MNEHVSRKPKVKRLESSIETRLKRAVEKRGGILKKLAYVISGDPDRLALLPGGWSCFVELKTWGKQPSKLQRSRLRKLDRLGFNTKIVNDEKSYIALVQEMDNHILV